MNSASEWEQVIGDGGGATAREMGGDFDFGGILGGRGRGGNFGGGGGGGVPPINYGGGYSQGNYFRGGGGNGGGSYGFGGGGWGQGQHGGGMGGLGRRPMWWETPAVPSGFQDWNSLVNYLSVVNSYPFGSSTFENGDPFQNCGYFPSYGGPPHGHGHLRTRTTAATSGRGGGRRFWGGEKYSRKVFLGGLPPDIDEEEIVETFEQFGPLVVDWPRKSQGRAYIPPSGYAFLLFEREVAVKQLINGCVRGHRSNKLFYFLSSPTVKAKAVQVRPWRLADADFWVDKEMKKKMVGGGGLEWDRDKVAFVGGVPRPLKAVELAREMDELFGGVGFVRVSVDKRWKYPKGCGKVGFLTKESYDKAVGQGFVWFRYGSGWKQVEVKPFLGEI